MNGDKARLIAKIIATVMVVCGFILVFGYSFAFMARATSLQNAGKEPPNFKFGVFFAGFISIFIGSIILNAVRSLGRRRRNYHSVGRVESERESREALPSEEEAFQNGPVCRECGKRNPLGSNFCANCGSPISAKIKCPRCGATNDEGSNFCMSCGKNLRE